MSNTDTDTDLETRVEQLTAIVQAQQQQLDALREAAGVDGDDLVSRRSLLQGGASVGAAGLLGALASGSAAAASPGSDGDTVWGSQNNRDDWYADFIDTNTIQTDEIAYSGDPPGAVVTLSSSQTISNDTVTKVAFDSGVRDSDGLLNSSNNSVDVPSGFSFARVVFFYEWSGAARDVTLLRPRVNGGGTTPDTNAFSDSSSPLEAGRTAIMPSPWFAVSQNDSITYEIRQESGSSRDLSTATNMEVWLI